MNYRTALVDTQMWAWDERVLYLFACLTLFGFISFLFWRAKK